MTSSVIGALRVTLGLDSAQFTSGAQRASGQAASFAGRMKKSFQSAEGSVQSLGGVFGSLTGPLAALTGVAGARGLLAIADQAKSITSQLKLATAQTGNFAIAQADVARIAASTRGGLAETASLYGNFVRATSEMGATQADAARATETFAKALKIGGADAGAAASATLQFGQALASGVLRGDEFNSIMEASPRIARLLADSLGVPRGALRAMAEEGQLTSEKLLKALTDTKFTEGLDKEFQQMPVTFDQAMTLVQNAAVTTFGAFDDGGQFSSAIADFFGRGADGFAGLAQAATEEGINIRAAFEGLSDAFSPLLAGAQSAFGGIRQEANYTRETIATLLGAIDTLRNAPKTAGDFILGGSQAFQNMQRAAGQTPYKSPIQGSNLQGAFRQRYDRSQDRLRGEARERRLSAMFGNTLESGRVRIGTMGAPKPRSFSRPSSEKKDGKGNGKDPAIAAAQAARKAQVAADKLEREERQYANSLAQERAAELRARADLSVEATERLALERDLRAAELKHRLDAIAGDRDLSEAKKKELSDIARSTAGLEEQLGDRRGAEQLAREQLDLAQARNEAETDILRAENDLAKTSGERRKVELQLLALQFEQLRAEQNGILASKEATEVQKTIARERLATLGRLEPMARAQVLRQTQGPLGGYADSVPRTADEINEALQRVQVDGLQGITDGLAEVIAGTRSLGDVFESVSKQIIADLARIAIQKAIVGPLTKALGGDGSGYVDDPSRASFVTELAGKRAKGGPVLSGKSYLVGEKGPEMFTPSAAGRIIANDDMPASRGTTIHQTLSFSGGVDLATRGEVYRVADAARQAAIRGVREADRRRG